MMFQDLSDSEQSKVKEVIQRLMEVNLLIKDKDRELYATIRRYRTALEGYYRFLGWELVVDERHECVYLHIPMAVFAVGLTGNRHYGCGAALTI